MSNGLITVDYWRVSESEDVGIGYGIPPLGLVFHYIKG